MDDVFSELDGSRRRALTTFLKDYQTIITTTEADIVQKNFSDKSNLIAL
jgi:recombinational DNA repair ATPase RecF